MKAKLIFNLDNSDELKAYNRCNKATEMSLVLFQISINVRKGCETVEDVFIRIDDLMDRYNIDVDELVE